MLSQTQGICCIYFFTAFLQLLKLLRVSLQRFPGDTACLRAPRDSQEKAIGFQVQHCEYASSTIPDCQEQGHCLSPPQQHLGAHFAHCQHLANIHRALMCTLTGESIIKSGCSLGFQSGSSGLSMNNTSKHLLGARHCAEDTEKMKTLSSCP